MASSLTRDFTATPTNAKKFTVSFWIRFNEVEGNQTIMTNYGNNGGDTFAIQWRSDEGIGVIDLKNSGVDSNLETDQSIIDTTAWYHFVVIGDTTLSTAADRVQLYINGERVTVISSQTNPSQDSDFNWNKETGGTSVGHVIGMSGNSTNQFTGQLAHIHNVDGTAYAATTFAETDTTSGIWKPILNPSVTYGNNGWFLKFENSGSMGTDSSGNSNNFTVAGDLKQSNSTPHNKYPYLNGRMTHKDYDTKTYLLDGGKTFLGDSSTTRNNGIDMCFAGGKWYWEAKIESASASSTLGVFLTDSTSAKRIYQSSSSGDLALQSANNGGNGAISFLCNSSSLIQQGNSTTSYGTGISDGDIIMFAFDATTGKVWTGRNGTWFNAPSTSNAGNPASGTYDSGKTLTNTDRELYSFYIGGQASSGNKKVYTNFGDGFFGTTAVSSANADGNGHGIFEYAVPSGFLALCSKNIQSDGG